MANPAPLCTHVKTDGTTCGSPAVAGTALCYHHSTVKAALGRVQPQAGNGEFAPIPFVFPEDRASMQINFFLLLQAFNEGRIDLKRFKVMMSLLKAMAANLGKTGSLVEDREQGSGGQKGSKPTSQKRDVGHPHPQQASEEPFEFSSEMMAEFEEIERLSPNDPSYAERIRAAVAEGANELRAHGIDLKVSPVAGSLAR